jgi:hypothetical protein
VITESATGANNHRRSNYGVNARRILARRDLTEDEQPAYRCPKLGTDVRQLRTKVVISENVAALVFGPGAFVNKSQPPNLNWSCAPGVAPSAHSTYSQSCVPIRGNVLSTHVI